MVKFCNGCLENKNITYFNIDNSKKDGLQRICKKCQKDYREKNKKSIKDKQKSNYQKNKDSLNNKQKKYYKENRELILRYQKKYASENKYKIKKYKREYNKNRMKNDPEYQIQSILKSRFNSLIKEGVINYSGSKTKRSQELLGCSLLFFKEYIENLFTEGMSFENHGMYGWHYDHIKPLSSFNLLEEEEQKIAFHYTNIQPLWAEDNLSKGNNY